MPNLNVIQVACAILIKEKKVLIARRADNQSMPGMWEFPGGKVEVGELPQDTVIRELFEELQVRVEPVQKLQAIEHVYKDFTIKLFPFIVKHLGGEFKQRVHSKLDFADFNTLNSIALLPADVLILPQLKNILN